MKNETYDIFRSNIKTCINDQNSKTPIRSYTANRDIIQALLSIANELLTSEEFDRLYALCPKTVRM